MKKSRKKDPLSYKERNYRNCAAEDLVASQVKVKETDLHIHARDDVSERALELVMQYRMQLEAYVSENTHFINALEPLPVDKLSPPMIKEMLRAGEMAGVGPMAAVAGTMASRVGISLIEEGYDEIIVENGGDIYMYRRKESIVGIFAGESPLSYRVGLRIKPGQMPCGICTSSGTIGHSLSLGDADSVTVVAQSTALADAAATRLGNEAGWGQRGQTAVQKVLETARKIEGLTGVVVICNDTLGAVGDLELVKISS